MSIELRNENRIMKTRGRCGYFSVTQDLNGKIIIYYRSSYPENAKLGFTMPTRYLISNDGIDFAAPDNDQDIIIQNTGICHNFFAFYDSNRHPALEKKYKGIGGTHWRKQDPFWHRRDRHKGVQKNTEETHGYRGLHLYTSDDGLKWDCVSNKPFLSRRSPGFQTRGRRQAREFDGHLSIIYNHKTGLYMLYARANVRAGVRHIQYATSKDFKEWSPFSLVEFHPTFRNRTDNYYSPNFFKHPDNERFLGLLPYIRRNRASLRLVISEDGVKWRKIEDFFKERPWFDDGEPDKPKNPKHPVNGYAISKDKKEMYIYVQHNYFNHEKRKPIRIRRYAISMDTIMSL